MEYKVDKETAKSELDRWFEGWGMEFDEDSFDQEDRKEFDSRINDLIFAVRRERLHYDDDKKTIVYKLRTAHKETEMVEIPIPKGAAIIEMDGYKNGQDMRKSFSVVAALIGKSVQFVSGMDERDIMFILGVNTLFLAS